jgi:NADH-quinone oxidoreductase subunit L
MVARSAPLFGQSAEASAVVAWVGAITALYAAIIAIKQYDIKRVLAYSTVSQLGYMFIGVGVGAYAAGVSHLITHAFFKALMFLGAGAVMHALEGQLDMRKMGNMKAHMKVTFFTFFFGWLAIAGVPPFAGFFSKDYILESAKEGGHDKIFWIGIFTAGLTAFYMSRMFFTVFFGHERIEMGDEGHGGDAQEHGKQHQHGVSEQHKHEHDSHGHGHSHDDHSHGHAHVHPELGVCNIPLIVLAIASVVGGFLIVPGLYGYLHSVTAAVVPEVAARGHEAGEHGGGFNLMTALSSWETWTSVAVGVIGILIAWFGWGPDKFAQGWSASTERALGAMQNAYEGTLHAIFVTGGEKFSEVLYQFVDRGIIDRAVNLAGEGTAGLAESLRTLQTGYVRNYALVMLAGSVFVVACFMIILQQWPWLNWKNVLPVLITVVVVGVIASFISAKREPIEAEGGPAEPSH